MFSLGKFVLYVSAILLSIVCSTYLPYVINACFTPNDELGMALLSGFPTDYSSLAQVQHLVTLLNKTRATNPVYVHVLFGVNFIHRHLLPPFDWSVALGLFIEQYVTFKTYFGYSHEFYLNTMAGALYGEWLGVVVCCLLASIAIGISITVNSFAIWILSNYSPSSTQVDRHIEELPIDQPEDHVEHIWPIFQFVPQRFDLPFFLLRRLSWKFLILIQMVVFVVLLKLRVIFSCFPSWMFNLTIVTFMSPGGNIFRRLSVYLFIICPIMTSTAVGYLPYAWFCINNEATRMEKLHSADGTLDNWLCYVASFGSVTIWLVLYLHKHFPQNVEDRHEEGQDEEDQDEDDQDEED